MKTTLEMPDAILRKAKAKAAERGVPLRQFVTEAVEAKLRESETNTEKPWMKMFGGLRHLHKENLRIQRIIDEEFEQIEPEDRD
ncbi:MAG: antitoxin [Bryobacteraceae bacterium]